MIRQRHTLIINRSDSKCGNCGMGADPKETTHDTILGYGPFTVGCGERFVLVRSDYTGMQAACERMRPDLAWVGQS